MNLSDPLSQVSISNPLLRSTRDGFGEALVELGAIDPRVVVVSADLAESTRCLEFSRQFPDRFFEVGVAEQNLAGVAAGLAAEGLIPFIASYAVFSPGRNWEQIRVSICYSGLNVKIVGSHSGLSAGPDGATHQSLEDIALTRVLPGMAVVVPADAIQAKAATWAAAQRPGPVYLRLTRPEMSIIYSANHPFVIGKADVVREGSDVTVIACGLMVQKALEAAQKLQQSNELRVVGYEFGRGGEGKSDPSSSPPLSHNTQHTTHNGIISVEVLNMSTIKPLDVDTLLRSVRKTRRVITIEDHQVIGGLGSAVAEVLGEECPVPMRRLGVRDSFGESGEVEELYRKYHLAVEDIVKVINEVVAL